MILIEHPAITTNFNTIKMDDTAIAMMMMMTINNGALNFQFDLIKLLSAVSAAHTKFLGNRLENDYYWWKLIFNHAAHVGCKNYTAIVLRPPSPWWSHRY